MSARYLLRAITHPVKGNLIKCGHVSSPMQQLYHIQRRSIADSASKPWMLFSAICLERLPTLSTTSSEFEQNYGKMLKTEEVEKSSLSDHELRFKEDEKILKTQKEGVKEEEETARKTTAEFEDLWEAEFNSFQFPSQLTEADKKGDTRSLQRKCDAKLILLAKQKLGSKEFWILPQGVHQQGESMRETAERVLRELCGEEINGIFLGNAPCGFYKYKYPPNHENVGAKVFFFRAHHRTGNVSSKSEDLIDFSWLTKQEIADKTPSEYFKAIDQFIVDL
ncbi:39S ribosomal protein L46, mitochondrial isoform X3 [Octopus sinensis]|uniref:Large ribosomal subunit protein mL46 n=1 Tax=Octopus sinensis TaxID=2607531 RepID=A0A6P7TCP3_9MOLL|nr:39S ribosomal protein L46, mitochondrial isoform X3 [Octopus sinensis]